MLLVTSTNDITFDLKCTRIITSDMYRIVMMLINPTNFRTRDKNCRGFPSDDRAEILGGRANSKNIAKAHQETRGIK